MAGRLNEHRDWREIVTTVMSLPNNMPDLIRSKWTENTEIARQRAAMLAPQRFAEMFVDANLVK